jgi:hypothetical protein
MQDANAKSARRERVPLDWSRLLGFDQVGAGAPGDAAARRARLTKVGIKIGGKPKQRA